MNPPNRVAYHSRLLLLPLLLLLLLASVTCQAPDEQQTSSSSSSPASALTAVKTSDDDDDDGGGRGGGVGKDSDNTGDRLQYIKTADDDGVDIKISSEEHQTVLDSFHPTEEWQEVKEGQAIPPGLQIRLDLQTGQKQAKLMPGQSVGDLEYWKSENREGMRYKNKHDLSPDDLKQALKQFKQHRSKDQNPAKAAKLEQKKRDFELLRSSITSDAEMVTELNKQLKNPAALQEGDLQTILSELEFLLHQIDTAQLFAELGGLPLIVNLLNSSDEDVRRDAALVLGSAMQSNPIVQSVAIEAGILQKLLPMISTEPSLVVRKKCVYALSVLLRHNLHAQHHFLALGGLTAVGQLFSESKTAAIQVKIVTLLSDLLAEKEMLQSQSVGGSAKDKERYTQYESMKLLEKMTEAGWCDRVAGLLHLQDYDSQEKVLTASNLIMSTCRPVFRPWVTSLRELRTNYAAQCSEEQQEGDTEQYFCNLHSLAHKVLTSLTHKVEL
ncbi:nucleotide exchange factor SIL1-like [Argonauta hians]